MEKLVNVSEWSNERKSYSRDAAEVCHFNLEDISNTHPISTISSFVSPFDSSKENVELSLEVEIADSLKHLIVSPEKHDSALVDVTIVRPTDLDCIPGLENSNTIAFKGSEVRSLIASMERQKQQKKKLIEECKRKVATCRMNTINEVHTIKSHTSSTQLVTRKEEHASASHKRRLSRSENARSHRNDIAVSSAPAKTTTHTDYRLDHFRNLRHPKAAPIAILQPLVGEIKDSLKSLEATIGQVGDQNISRKNKKKKQEKIDKLYYLGSDSNPSSDFIHPKHLAEAHRRELTTHQVFAAPNTYDKLRTLLACQNTSQQNDDDSKVPCLCQHCGMVGLLVESQKRPIVPVPTGPSKKPDSAWQKTDGNDKTENDHRKQHSKSRCAMDKSKCDDGKTKLTDEGSYWLIREISNRIEALEVRLAAQEQRAVPKEYFKRIINKLWHRTNSSDDAQFIMRANNTERNLRLKDRSTQYSVESIENVVKPKRDSRSVKHRNVQIQQNTRKTCCVNPVIVVPNAEMSAHGCEFQSDSSKSLGSKAINAISDFFVKKGDSDKKCGDHVTLNEKNNAIEAFWKWGEEIIKPGFDLKTKIISLLNEQFTSVKNTDNAEQKNTVAPNKSERKTEVLENVTKSKTRNTKDINCKKDTNTKLPNSNTLEEKKVVSHDPEQTKKEDKINLTRTSTKTLKKMLDIMSDKIYNERVRPTVEAIKQEQKCFNTENIKQIDNIKAAMDAALSKINTKEVEICNSSLKNMLPYNNGWQDDFLEPLELPATIKRRDYRSKTCKYRKKSGIPIRISNMGPTESTVSDPLKFKENPRSLIPRLKSPKDLPNVKMPNWDKECGIDSRSTRENQEKNRKKEKHIYYSQKITIPKKQDACQILPILNPAELKLKKPAKPVQIKYLNPKAEYWNDESCPSVLGESSEENNQVILTDNSSRSRDNNKEEIRRISEKYSVTGTAQTSSIAWDNCSLKNTVSYYLLQNNE